MEEFLGLTFTFEFAWVGLEGCLRLVEMLEYVWGFGSVGERILAKVTPARSECYPFSEAKKVYKENKKEIRMKRDNAVRSLTLGSGTGLRTSLRRTCSYCLRRSRKVQARSRRCHQNRTPRCSMLHCCWYSIRQETSVRGCFARCCPGRRGPRV